LWKCCRRESIASSVLPDFTEGLDDILEL
jgi:hypothetical protein